MFQFNYLFAPLFPLFRFSQNILYMIRLKPDVCRPAMKSEPAMTELSEIFPKKLTL